MYKIGESAKLQVMRRVSDAPQATVVFHVIVLDDKRHDSYTDYIQLYDGAGTGLRLKDPAPANGQFPITEQYAVNTPTGYTDAMAALPAGDVADAVPEDYLRSIGVLPPVWSGEPLEE